MHDSKENIPLWKQLEMQGVSISPTGDVQNQNQGKTVAVKKRNEEGGYSSLRVKKSSLPDLQRLISMYHVKTGTQTNLAGIVEALIELGMREWK